MNQDQVLSLVRWIISAAGGFVIGKGWLNAEQLTMVGGLVTTLVPLVWSLFAHTNSAKLASAAAIPGIVKLEATVSTPEARTLVNSAAAGPNVSSKV